MAPSVALHYAEQGAGLPVLLLHGFPFDHTLWAAQAAALSAFCRVITPDLRGHGRSPAPGGVYSMEALAADVAALLDRLEIARAVWIGHSMGGYLTLAALRDLPERVLAVGLIATHPYADPPARQQQRLQTAEQALTGQVAPIAEGMLAALFAPPLDRHSATVQALYAVMARTPAQAIAGAQRGMAARPDTSEALRAAQVPVLVIAGAQDAIVPLEVARGMAALQPKSVLHVIDGAGHLPMFEQPAATTEALQAFLAPLAEV